MTRQMWGEIAMLLALAALFGLAMTLLLLAVGSQV